MLGEDQGHLNTIEIATRSADALCGVTTAVAVYVEDLSCATLLPSSDLI